MLMLMALGNGHYHVHLMPESYCTCSMAFSLRHLYHIPDILTKPKKDGNKTGHMFHG